MSLCIDWIWEGYKNSGRKFVPCVIPPCTLKLDESDRGLEPRYPLHSFSHKLRLRAELGTPTLKFPGVLLQDSCATSWPRAGTWLCAYPPSLSLCSAVQWNKVQAGSRSCPVLWQIPWLSAWGAGCSVYSARGHPWLWQKQLLSAQTVPVPMGCEGQSCLSPWKLMCSCGKREAGTPVSALLNILVFCPTSV